jgi:transcriptional regulator with XRE-family HTH domain
VTDEFNVSLGQRLRAARRQRGWSLGEIEAQTDGEFKASVVGAYERGERAISVQRFVRLAQIYGVPANELLPVPEPAVGLVIDLDALAGEDSGDLVDKYLAAIQLLRKDGAPNVVRQSDRAIINSLLQAVSPTSSDRTA